MNVFYLRKLEISYASEFSILAHILKSKTWKKYLQRVQIPRNVFYLRKLEISEVYEFSILALILRDRKLGKLGNFVLSEFVLFEEVRNF